MNNKLIIICSIALFIALYFFYTQKECFEQGIVCYKCSEKKTYSKCSQCENCSWCPIKKECIESNGCEPYNINCGNKWMHRDPYYRRVMPRK